MKTQEEYQNKWGMKLGTYLYNKEQLGNDFIPCINNYNKYDNKKESHKSIIFIFIVLTIMFILSLFSGCAQAQENIAGYDIQKWADAIYKAEGNDKTKYPYGILKRYKVTTPRQACINTVRHKYQDWLVLKANKGLREDFIDYLASKYAPNFATNDPKRLNKNWAGNVRYWLTKGD